MQARRDVFVREVRAKRASAAAVAKHTHARNNKEQGLGSAKYSIIISARRPKKALCAIRWLIQKKLSSSATGVANGAERQRTMCGGGCGPAAVAYTKEETLFSPTHSSHTHHKYANIQQLSTAHTIQNIKTAGRFFSHLLSDHYLIKPGSIHLIAYYI
jgi:hypothetical protein